MPTASDFQFTAIDGSPLPLSGFAGKVVLVVNVASRCGLTPQYNALVDLDRTYRSRGLVVLGAPCNQFMGQEPGTEAEIASFCSTTFGVDFPLTAKIDVKGKGVHPFYDWAKAELGEAGTPGWNFHKILVGRDGRLIAGFGSRTAPDDASVIATIEAALAET